MGIDNIYKLVNKFELLAVAEKEELPENSKDLKTILKNIENLETFNARKKYAEKNLKHLSSGSSRVVYLTPDKTILKLAKNDRGIAQNKAESNPKMKSEFLNKILSKASNFAWIETRYLDKITEKQFKKMTGLNFKDFGDAIEYGLKSVADNSDKSKPSSFDDICDSKIYKEFIRIGKRFKLMPGDIARISSWGHYENSPVLIDAGLTKEIFDEYYD